MKIESLNFLAKYLEFYVHDGIDGLYEFYKDYSTYEVTSIDELKSSVNDFCEYLKDNVGLIKRKYGYIDSSIIRSIFSFKRSIMHSIDRYLNDAYRDFSKLVYEVSPNKENEKILEVGSGRIPSSSIYLAGAVKKILTMDSEFYLSDASLKNMGVDSRERLFDESVNVDGFSFVVGRSPCSAIKHMVSSCRKADIPYLIKLCDCEIIASKKLYGVYRTWNNILLERDDKVKIYKGFAYNLDVNERDLDLLLEKYDKNIPERTRKLKIDPAFYEQLKIIEEEKSL